MNLITLSTVQGDTAGDYQNLDIFTSSTGFTNISKFSGVVGSTCGRIFDISKYIPVWVTDEKLQRQSTDPTNSFSIFDFLQLYYDWLYCDGASGAGYMLSQNLLDLADVEKTNPDFLNRYMSMYLPGISPNLLSTNGGTINVNNFTSFVKSIRTNLYQQKTTPDGVKYFFKTLFGIEPDEVEIYEPKQIMLRLNGGRFGDPNFKFVGGSTGSYSGENPLYNLAGSYLNGSRMQDGDWIHNYSYLLKVGMTADMYIDSYLSTMHPAGLRVVFEKTMQDYVGPGGGDGEGTSGIVCEYPVLKNYGAYRLDTTYTLTGTGPNNMSLYGLSACAGCTYTGFTGPSHYFPSWLGTITPPPTKFKDIPIFDFFNLCYSTGVTSPNDVRSCSGC